MEKKSRKSASKWEQAGERTLIAIWADKMGELRGCRKNSHILVEMVLELEKQGYSYSVVELKTKMHNLSARYRKEKQKIGTTGGSPSDWDLFPEMQSLLAPYKSYHTENLVQDSITDIYSSIEVSSPQQSAYAALPSPSPLPSTYAALPSPSPLSSTYAALPSPSPHMSEDSLLDMSPPSPQPSSSRATKRGKKKDTLCSLFQKVEMQTEKMLEEMKKTSEKILKIETEKKDILKEYAEREAEVQKALVEFLKRQ